VKKNELKVMSGGSGAIMARLENNMLGWWEMVGIDFCQEHTEPPSFDIHSLANQSTHPPYVPWIAMVQTWYETVWSSKHININRPSRRIPDDGYINLV